MKKTTADERAFGPLVAAMNIPYFTGCILRGFQRHTRWDEIELTKLVLKLGLPQTREEQCELAELAQAGPMVTERYYLWAAAIRDAQSRWSVTQAGKAALRSTLTTADRRRA